LCLCRKEADEAAGVNGDKAPDSPTGSNEEEEDEEDDEDDVEWLADTSGEPAFAVFPVTRTFAS
jgi:hypothetical protein